MHFNNTWANGVFVYKSGNILCLDSQICTSLTNYFSMLISKMFVAILIYGAIHIVFLANPPTIPSTRHFLCAVEPGRLQKRLPYRGVAIEGTAEVLELAAAH